jgi:hypothetical protein
MLPFDNARVPPRRTLRTEAFMLLLLVLGCSDPGTLTINNNEPTATIDAPSDGAGVVLGVPVTVEGTVGDAETPEVDLIVQWRLNDEVICDDSPDAFGETTCELFLPDGESDVRLQVADGGGGIAEATITLVADRCFDDEDTVPGLPYSQAIGSLGDEDLIIDGNRQDNFRFEGTAGDELAIHGWSEAFDVTVALYDASCELIASAQDGGRGSNALLRARLPSDGEYTMVIGAASGGAGNYVLEILDDSVQVGGGCGLNTDVIDLSTELSGSTTGVLTTTDQTWEPGFYYDDVETFLLYGDEVTVAETSSVFLPALSFFKHNIGSTGCSLVGYDGNDDEDYEASVTTLIRESGIYAPIPWARYYGATGAWTVTVDVVP